MVRFIGIVLFTLSVSAWASYSENGRDMEDASFWGAYGAIAYSPFVGAVGRSWNWGSRWQAEDVALSYCGSADCRVVVWVNNGCAALAVASYDRRKYGWGWEYSLAGAENRAMVACYPYQGPCFLRASLCSRR